MTTPAGTSTSPITTLVALPGTSSIPNEAPLYVNGIPVSFAQPPGIGQPADTSQQFWSSQPRMMGDRTEENLIISLSKAKLINYISLDLPHFPHHFQIAWLNPKTKVWENVLGPNGDQLIWDIWGAVPQIVNNPAALAAGLNPYHYGAGHWIHYDEMIQPVTTQMLMLSGTRGFTNYSGAPAGSYPVDTAGKPHAYPLGIRNFDFGYRIRSQQDVPWTGRDPDIVTKRQTFTTTTDLLGSPVQVSVRENRASDMLQGYPWKCAPQARADAVVSLYVDARDTAGNQQVVDRFYITPVTSGPSLNLYYSPQGPAPDAPMQAVDTPLVFPNVSIAGSSLPQPDPEGLLFGPQPGWLSLSNQAAGISAAAPWWVGIQVMPQFSSSDPGSYTIADGGIFQLSFTGGQFVIGIGGSLGGYADTYIDEYPEQGSPAGILAAWDIPFEFNDTLTFIAGFDGTQAYAWSPQIGTLAAIPLAPPFPNTPFIRFGAIQQPDVTETIWPGNFRLTSCVIKQEKQILDGSIPAAFQAFAADARGYVAPPSGPGTTTENALVRFDQSFMMGNTETGINPYGFVGGPGIAYTSCAWIPVQRDFKLAKGFIEFEPVLASVFKFEFTNLSPQTYEFFEVTPQKVQVFPGSAQAPAPDPEHETPLDAGLAVNQDVAPTVRFGDAPVPSQPPPQGAARPTEALYGTDPAAAAALVQQGGSLYNFQPWQPKPQAPQFVIAGTHDYQEIDLQQASRIAYFVSVSALVMYRTDYTAADDTAEYIDTFGDTGNLDPASLVHSAADPQTVPWTWSAGKLESPVNLTIPAVAQVTSKTFSSAHSLRGLQFAATQSAAVQLLADPDFADPLLRFWDSTGDALELEIVSGINTQLGSMVQVSRIAAPGLSAGGATYTWDYISANYQTWTGVAGAGPTWNDLQGSTQIASTSGGMAYAGAPLITTAAGRVYGAARVFSTQPLAEPLVLQLIDAQSGSVIAEQEQPVNGGTVTEWYVGYVIGAGADPTALTWDEVQSDYPSWSATAGKSWDNVDTTTPPLGAGISAQLIQRGVTSDTWFVDNLSVFEDSIVWEFSGDDGDSWTPAYDIRNNPSGALLFPPPQSGIGNQLKWRVTAYRPGLHVTSLAIRPWYGLYPKGVPPRPAGVGHGPNISPRDHYALVQDDPHWKAWDLPIPQDWFFAYRQLLLSETTFRPVLPSLPSAQFVLGNALVYIPVVVAPPPPSQITYEDIYADAYLDPYGLEEQSNVFGDIFGDDY